MVDGGPPRENLGQILEHYPVVMQVALNVDTQSQQFMQESLALWFNHWRTLGWFAQQADESFEQ